VEAVGKLGVGLGVSWGRSACRCLPKGEKQVGDDAGGKERRRPENGRSGYRTRGGEKRKSDRYQRKGGGVGHSILSRKF